jgi:Holliday junction resolvasome RuvABC DNA-binding subunit
MQAFHNNTAIKKKYVDRVLWHQKMAHEIDSRECKITELTKLAQSLRAILVRSEEALDCLGHKQDEITEILAEADKILGVKNE